jgi:hypothetical protein
MIEKIRRRVDGNAPRASGGRAGRLGLPRSTESGAFPLSRRERAPSGSRKATQARVEGRRGGCERSNAPDRPSP